MSFITKSNINIKHITGLVLGIALVLSSCLDPIDLAIPEGSEDAIVINSKITMGTPSTFKLEMSRLFNFTVESRGNIIARNVIISDEEGNELEVKPNSDSGYYYEFDENDPVKIEIGKKYKILVQTFDGRTFESTYEQLHHVPKIKNVSYRLYDKVLTLPDQSQRVVPYIAYDVSTDLTHPAEQDKSQIRWELEKVYRVTDSPINGSPSKVCYLTSRAGVFNVLVYDGQADSKTELADEFLYEEAISPLYAEGSYFVIIQESLSKNAMDYWRNVKSVTERKEDIYADPPGKVASNFTHINGEEEAYGFFYVTVQDTARIYINPEELGEVDRRCPSEDLVNMDGSCGDQLCCNCLSEDNSTLTKPSFWTN